MSVQPERVSTEASMRATVLQLEEEENVEGHAAMLPQERLFKIIDTDSSGTIDATEFAKLYNVIHEEARNEIMREGQLEASVKKGRRRLRAAVCIAVILFCFLGVSVAANFGVTYTLLEMMKEVETASDGTLLVAGSTQAVKTTSADFSVKSDTMAEANGAVVATRTAEVHMPLFVAPVLPREQLETLRAVTVSLNDWSLERLVEETLYINGITRVNSTHIILRSREGKTLTIKNGEAFVTYPDGVGPKILASNGNLIPVTGFQAAVCAGDAACSSFTIDAQVAVNLTHRALEALDAVGINTSDVVVRNRRSLASLSLYGVHNEWSQLSVIQNDAYSTGEYSWEALNYDKLYFHHQTYGMIYKAVEVLGTATSTCFCAYFTVPSTSTDLTACRIVKPEVTLPSSYTGQVFVSSNDPFSGKADWSQGVPVRPCWHPVADCLVADAWSGMLGKEYNVFVKRLRNKKRSNVRPHFWVDIEIPLPGKGKGNGGTREVPVQKCNVLSWDAPWEYATGEGVEDLQSELCIYGAPTPGNAFGRRLDAIEGADESGVDDNHRELQGSSCSYDPDADMHTAIVEAMTDCTTDPNPVTDEFAVLVADFWCDCWAGQYELGSVMNQTAWDCIFNGGGPSCWTDGNSTTDNSDWVTLFIQGLVAQNGTTRRLMEAARTPGAYTADLHKEAEEHFDHRRRRLSLFCPDRAARLCHPAHATIELDSGTHIRIDALAVGDVIRTPSGFEPVVGFLHADAHAATNYHMLTTDKNATIAISDKHWLFIDGVEVDPATARIGQTVSTPSGPQRIISIAKEMHDGAYHPVTASGAYYVDGVAASTYAAYIPRSAWKIFGDGYITLRYRLGLPVVPEGAAAFTLFWLMDTLTAVGVPDSVQSNVFWPLISASVMLTELASATSMAVAKTMSARVAAAIMVAPITLKAVRGDKK